MVSLDIARKLTVYLLLGATVLSPLVAVQAVEPVSIPEYVFERQADDLGGRQASVYEIYADQQGFIWFAGDTDGLLRYDGNQMLSWSEGFQQNLTRHNVSAQRIDSDGRLWVGSWGNGLQYWDAQTRQYVDYLADANDPHSLADNRVQTLHLDARGRLWIGTADGINFIDPSEPLKLQRLAANDLNHPLHNERVWRFTDLGDSLWMATSNGVFRLNYDLDQWQQIYLDAEAAATIERGAEVREIARIGDEIWAGSQFGVYVYLPRQQRFELIPWPQPERGNPRVNVLFPSRDGRVWMGGHDGLYLIDREKREYLPLGPNYHQIADVDIRGLYQDHDQHLWIGTRDNGLIRGRQQRNLFADVMAGASVEVREQAQRLHSALFLDASSRLWVGVPGGFMRRDQFGDWQQWSFPVALNTRRVERIVQSPDGTVWLATDQGLFRMDNRDQLHQVTELYEQINSPRLPVNELFADKDGSLWIALWQYGIVHWHPQQGVLNVGLEQLQTTRGDLIYHLHADKQGTLWASSRYSGVFKHIIGAEGWQQQPIPQQPQQHHPAYYCVLPSADFLWLCTEDGLLQLNLATMAQRRFGRAEGLPAERIVGLFDDPQLGMWVLTTNGLARMNSDRQRFISYGLADGLPALGLQRNAIIRDGDQLLLSTAKGSVRIFPTAFGDQIDSPPMVVSRVWIDGEDLTRTLSAPISLALPYQHRDVMIQVSVLDAHDEAGNLIRYRLRNFEQQWSDLTSIRTIRYMNLPPGDYVLEVEGWSSRGIATAELLQVPVSVAAPWWYARSFWFGSLGLLTVLAWLLLRWRVHALNVQNSRLQQQVSERTEALQLANDKLLQQSTHDFLTGVLNRRGVSIRFRTLQQQLGDNALTVVLLDLDYFKQLNDNYGHEVGDDVLTQVAHVLQTRLRKHDVVGRWGGEEFVLLLPNCELPQALELCRLVNEQLQQINMAATNAHQVTATMGVVTGPAQPFALERWVKAADDALYAGKRAGRNRIEVGQLSASD